VDVPDWHDEALLDLIAKGAFIDDRGDFLFIAPHAPRRGGYDYGRGLTAVTGGAVDIVVSHSGATRLISQGLYSDRNAICFLPFVPSRLGGVFSHSTREYFIPGDAWRIRGLSGSTGPAKERKLNPIGLSLLNVETVRLDADSQGCMLVGAIFDLLSAKALTSWLDDPTQARRLIALEYLKHEYGHAAGIGMGARLPAILNADRKRRIAGLGIDEARADGTRSEFYTEYLTGSDQERDLTAVTLMIRMLDLIRSVHTRSEYDFFEDVDIIAALKWFEEMVEGGTLFRHRGVNRPGKSGLVQLGFAPCVDWRNPTINAPATFDSIDLRHVAGPMVEWSASVENHERKELLREDGSMKSGGYDPVIERHASGERFRRLFETWLVKPCRSIM
jgi:hypothetical protein